MPAHLEDEGKQIAHEVGIMGIIICLKFIATIVLICAGYVAFL